MVTDMTKAKSALEIFEGWTSWDTVPIVFHVRVISRSSLLADARSLSNILRGTAMKKQQKENETPTGIPCNFREIPEWVSTNWGDRKKSGRYSATNFHIPGFGKRSGWCWLILNVPDIKILRAQGMTEDEILEGCVEYLNQPPRKKYQRRKQEALYGKLELLSYRFTEKKGEPLLCVSLITDQRKNKNFWGSDRC